MYFNLRKILLFINITLSLLIIGILAFVYLKNKPTILQNDQNKQTPQAKVIENPKILADMPIIGLNIEEFSGKIKFYGLNDGALYEVIPDQTPKLIANPNLKNIKQITWSPDDLKVFVDLDQTKYIYDFLLQKAYSLNNNIQSSLVFSPDSQKILYNFKDSIKNQNIISVADFNGKNYSKVILSPTFNPTLSWTINGVYLWRKSEPNFVDALYLINLSEKTIVKILDSIFGIDVKTAPSGLKFLYQQYLNEQLTLHLYDLGSSADGVKDIKLPFATLAQKCVFAQNEQEIYCALDDQIINYNFQTKIQNQIAKINFTIFNLQITPDEKYLIFQDLTSNKPYFIKIK